MTSKPPSLGSPRVPHAHILSCSCGFGKIRERITSASGLGGLLFQRFALISRAREPHFSSVNIDPATTLEALANGSR